MTSSDALLRALGWALAHSLWQATLLALALFVLLPRLKTARQRYWTAYSTLGLMLMVAVGTFCWTFEPQAPSVSFPSTTVGDPIESTLLLFDNQYFATNLGADFSQWLDTNHTLIVALWLLGFLFFLLRLGGGLWQVRRLRTQGIHGLEAVWQEKMQALGGRIGAPRATRLLESSLVRSPLTLGWWKPIVLLPLGFVNQLSPAEVEAVLAHELAHIARRDWVFNLLQAFIESLFYYHPAVWWVSGVIRRERENACDDVALAVTGNPIAFARALVQVQEMATPALALALSGPKRRPLLERVRRILNQAPQQKQNQVMEKITATVILLALLALIGLRANSVPSLEAAFAQITDFPDTIWGTQTDGNQSVADTLPKPKSTQKISREDENGRVEVEFNDGEISRLNIDGKEIPASEYEDHEELIESLQAETPPAPPAPPGFWGAPDAPAPAGSPDFPSGFGFPAPMPPMPAMGRGMSIVTDKDGEGNTIIRLDTDGNSSEVIVKNGEVWVDGKKVEQGAAVNIPGMQWGADGQHFFFGDADFEWNTDALAFNEEANERMAEEMERAREVHQRAMEEHRRTYEQDRKRSEKDWKESQKEWEREQKAWQKEQQQWEKEQQKWAREQEKWAKDQQKWEAEHHEMARKSEIAQELIQKELKKDGLISDPKNFSLKLSAKELKVNGKKQSEEMRRKYEELIQKTTGASTSGDDWNYNINRNGN